jgi:hypothetical protein
MAITYDSIWRTLLDFVGDTQYVLTVRYNDPATGCSKEVPVSFSTINEKMIIYPAIAIRTNEENMLILEIEFENGRNPKEVAAAAIYDFQQHNYMWARVARIERESLSLIVNVGDLARCRSMGEIG